jgi:hypothetical protein
MAEPSPDNGDTALTAVIRDALEKLGIADPLTLAEVAFLHRNRPRWAVLVPADGAWYVPSATSGWALPTAHSPNPDHQGWPGGLR